MQLLLLSSKGTLWQSYLGKPDKSVVKANTMSDIVRETSSQQDNHYNRREFIKKIGATAAGMALSSCAISGDRSAKGLTEEALAVKPVVRPQDLEKPDITVGYVPVNDCAPFAIAWKKGFFRKYGLNVRLNREASWATSRDGLIFGRLDASPVVPVLSLTPESAPKARVTPLCALL